MMTSEQEREMREWEGRYRSFYEILEKLEENDLQQLTFILNCHPQYCGIPDKYNYIQNIWSRIRELKRGSYDARNLREALAVLR